MPNIPPISGGGSAPLEHVVTPAVAEIPGTVEENAKTGGRVDTKSFDTGETRPQELHNAMSYQNTTADPGKMPPFIAYTDLTTPRGTVKG
jgi:hypothetical protein